MSRTFSKENRSLKSDMNQANAVPLLWSNDKIPPLVSINGDKQKERPEQISIQSLNQSEVKSIYTIDKQDFDKHVLDIFANTDRSFRQNKGDKIKVEPVVISEQKQQSNYFQTPINDHKINNFQSTGKQFATSYKDEVENEYDNCPAVKIYSKIIQKSVNNHNKSEQGQKFEFDWMKTKSPTQMIASILTNRSRMNLYVHYLLNQIYKNQQAKIINELHQEPVKQYNPTLKQTYSFILCLLSKIDCNDNYNKAQTISKTKNNEQTNNQKPQISLFQNGLQIDINPKLTSIKKQNAQKIRKLKNSITQRQHQMQDTKRMYQQIIMNYAMTIQNLNKNEEQEGILRAPFQQSRVKLVVEEEEQEEIRKKNHTFGMKLPSNRSSRNPK